MQLLEPADDAGQVAFQHYEKLFATGDAEGIIPALPRRAKQSDPLSTPSCENIPLYRNSDLSYLSRIPAHEKGRSYVVSSAGWELRWTRAALKAGLLRAGRDEPREHDTTCEDERRPSPAEPRGEAGSPAYGETVWSWPSLLRSSLGEGVTRVNRRRVA